MPTAAVAPNIRIMPTIPPQTPPPHCTPAKRTPPPLQTRPTTEETGTLPPPGHTRTTTTPRTMRHPAKERPSRIIHRSRVRETTEPPIREIRRQDLLMDPLAIQCWNSSKEEMQDSLLLRVPLAAAAVALRMIDIMRAGYRFDIRFLQTLVLRLLAIDTMRMTPRRNTTGTAIVNERATASASVKRRCKKKNYESAADMRGPRWAFTWTRPPLPHNPVQRYLSIIVPLLPVPTPWNTSPLSGTFCSNTPTHPRDRVRWPLLPLPVSLQAVSRAPCRLPNLLNLLNLLPPAPAPIPQPCPPPRHRHRHLPVLFSAKP